MAEFEAINSGCMLVQIEWSLVDEEPEAADAFAMALLRNGPSCLVLFSRR